MEYCAVSLLFLALLRPSLVGAFNTTLVLAEPNQPVCSGETVTYRCTVGGDIITWHIPGGEFSQIYGRHAEGDEGSFHWVILERPAGSNVVESTLSFTAVDGYTIGCRNASEEFVSLQVQVEGPPSAPDQPLTSINRIDKINSTFSTVTVVWTRPEDNSDYITRYVMTVDPPTPLPANGIVELTDSLFMDRKIRVVLRHGQRYTFKVRADNCNNRQHGAFSSPLTIYLQVPPPATNCVATAVYDYYSNHLNSVEILWETVSDPPEPIAPGISADIQSYEVSVIPISEAPSVNVTVSDLTQCQDQCAFVLPSTGMTSLYYSVFVAAENVLGPGERKSCNSESIGARNDLVAVEVRQCEGSVEVSCRLLSGFVGTSHCEIAYGTDPTRAYLPFVDTSEDVGTGGDVITVKFTQPLETNSTYYYNLTTTHVNTAVRVLGTFKTAGYCRASDLGSPLKGDENQCRLNEGAASIRNGMVCYTGTATGSLAYYICDDGYELNVLLEGAMNPRECLQNGQWSKSDPECTSTPFKEGKENLTAWTNCISISQISHYC